jgi:3',5'-cyclic AMP phosphodiesterase CpdA
LNAIERAALTPAALLFTGDLTEAGDPEAYQRLRHLVAPVASRLKAPALYVMGNHDDRAAMRANLLGEPPTTDPYDYVVRLGDVRVVVLDSTVPGCAHGELTADQLSWLEAQLAQPAPDGTILALHHPPLPSPSRLATAIELSDRSALAAVLSGTDVRLIPAGHTHVVSTGSLAGIPVCTGGTTAFASGPLVADGGEQNVLSASVSRMDLFDDSFIVTAVAIDAEHVVTLSPEQVDALIHDLAS